MRVVSDYSVGTGKRDQRSSESWFRRALTLIINNMEV